MTTRKPKKAKRRGATVTVLKGAAERLGDLAMAGDVRAAGFLLKTIAGRPLGAVGLWHPLRWAHVGVVEYRIELPAGIGAQVYRGNKRGRWLIDADWHPVDVRRDNRGYVTAVAAMKIVERELAAQITKAINLLQDGRL